MKKTKFALMVASTATGMLLMSFTSMFPGENTIISPEDGSPDPRMASVIVHSPTSTGIEGTVVIMSTANPQGGVENVKLVQDIGGQCGEEACRAVRTLQFNAAMQHGLTVRQDIIVPVDFSLNSTK